MRPRARSVWAGLAACCLLAHTVAAEVKDSAVFVDIRESESPGARVVERWKLYGASHALVIGIDDYSEGWPRLSNAVKDAELVAAGLERRGFEVTLLTDVTSDQLRGELRRFFAIKGSDPEARLFVWFAGHGHTEYGEGYLVPADAPTPGTADFLFKALHMGDIGSMVRVARAKHVLAVFDSCFAGTVFSSSRARPPAAITRAAVEPVRQFLTSGDADQQVSDDGTFRTLFLRALDGDAEADANGDGYLTGTELSFYLEDRVVNLTRAAQTPRSGKLRDPRFDRGDFVFLLPRVEPADVAEPAEPEPPRVQTAALELAFWDAIKDSEDPGSYAAYLEAYPEGTFAPLARLRQQALGEAAQRGAVEPQAAQQAALPPASETPAFEIEEMEAGYVALKNANLRAGPSTAFDKVGRLAAGDEVTVTGKIVGQNWYRVALAEGGSGFVYGALLEDAVSHAARRSEIEEQRRLAEGRARELEEQRRLVAERELELEAQRKAAEESRKALAQQQRLAEERAKLEAERQRLAEEQRKLEEPRQLEARQRAAAQQAASSRAAGQQTQTALVTQPPPKKDKDREVKFAKAKAYLDDNQGRLRSRLSRYNQQHKLLTSDSSPGSGDYQIRQIRDYEVKDVAGDRVFVSIGFQVGIYWKQDGRVLFEMQWQDGELEFVGHR